MIMAEAAILVAHRLCIIYRPDRNRFLHRCNNSFGVSERHRAGLDAMGKRKTCPCRDSNPARKASGQSVYRMNYTDILFEWINLMFELK
jgi:hypothetical protein